ncbi:MAG: tetratricopeptide repeat protein [Sulfurovum sp.]|nr:tetratricopeptide repeat protein [Sulfurovum sp.]MDD3601944.1 tetratricopeptide repeat protein [Sulfurovum sp.]
MLKTLSIWSLVLFLIYSLEAKEPEEQTVNHMEIAAMMYYDGKYDKALEELMQAKDSHMDIEWNKYYAMRGLIFLKEEKYQESIHEFLEAIKALQKKVYTPPSEDKPKKEVLFSVFSKDKKADKPVIKKPIFDPEKLRKDQIEEIHIYLSQVYYKAGQYINAVQALDAAGDKGQGNASLFTLRAECYWKADQKGSALEALNRGTLLFPDDVTLLKQKFYYFGELKLYQAAIKAAKAYMKKIPAKAEEYIILAQMLAGGGESKEAIKILEEAKLKFPSSANVYILLGHYYNQNDMPYTTADLFEKGSYCDPKYTKEAAEMYRRNGLLAHALYLNSKMTDKIEKTKQKVAIYVSRGEFEMIIGLRDALDRYGLLNDDNIRYALAYSYYMAKDYESAEAHLKKIQDDELFSKATVIRKNIEKCRSNSLECI